MGKRAVLSVGEKKDICAYKERYPCASQQNIANHFSRLWGKPLSRRCVGDILSEREKWENERCENMKRLKGAKHEDLEDALIIWIGQVNARNGTTTDGVIKEQAKVIGQQMGVTNFVYSSGWLHRFKRRHGLSQLKKPGETAKINEEVVEAGRQRLYDIVKEYDPKDIYSMDESALFYRMQPDKTISDGPAKGCKKAKDRLTLALCTNADGSDKRTVTVIGKYANPRCFKNFNPSIYVNYRHNPKAWMTTVEFGEWIKDFNKDMKKKLRNVLLLVDNAPCHKPTNLSHVRLEFLPRNCSGSLQPLNSGIAKSFKAHYRCHQVRKIVGSINNGSLIHLSLKDALYLIKLAWDEVSSVTVSNCWVHSGLIRGVHRDQQDVHPVEDLQMTIEDLPVAVTRIQLTAEEFLEVDAEEPVFSEMTSEEIVHLARNDSVITDSESEDNDLGNGEKVTSKQAQICIEKIRKYFEQNSVNNGIIQHIVALDLAIGKINKKREVQTKIGGSFLPKKMRL
ncbi:tigger transposable element-derived protein 6-like [Zootermopsis nevadensis]|nr:tigger transposable element-derived protein 6-like [Zootermopsis nevadensis]